MCLKKDWTLSLQFLESDPEKFLVCCCLEKMRFPSSRIVLRILKRNLRKKTLFVTGWVFNWWMCVCCALALRYQMCVVCSRNSVGYCCLCTFSSIFPMLDVLSRFSSRPFLGGTKTAEAPLLLIGKLSIIFSRVSSPDPSSFQGRNTCVDRLVVCWTVCEKTIRGFVSDERGWKRCSRVNGLIFLSACARLQLLLCSPFVRIFFRVWHACSLAARICVFWVAERSQEPCVSKFEFPVQEKLSWRRSPLFQRFRCSRVLKKFFWWIVFDDRLFCVFSLAEWRINNWKEIAGTMDAVSFCLVVPHLAFRPEEPFGRAMRRFGLHAHAGSGFFVFLLVGKDRERK